MINKQSLWFLTIFSLVLVLSIYYFTMPNELLAGNNNKIDTEEVSGNISDEKVSIEESELLITMRVNLEDEREKEVKDLKATLTSEESTSEEKNNAFEKIKYITDLSSKEEALEKKISDEFKIDSFIKIDGSKVNVTAICSNHNMELVNKIMRLIQKEFNDKVSITIKFEK